MDFMASVTRENLMRAFAGESQARNRYTFAASAAKKQKMHVIEAVFTFTESQEKEHAEIFFKLLKEASGNKVHIDADYPVEVTDDVLELLRSSQQHEYEEHSPIYSEFAKVAKNEGFTKVADAFTRIAAIEKTHGDRFGRYADMVQNNTLFAADGQEKWMCLNCGYVHIGERAPGGLPGVRTRPGLFHPLGSRTARMVKCRKSDIVNRRPPYMGGLRSF